MTDAPFIVSVSGLRGMVGSSLTDPVAARFAAAFGQWLRHRGTIAGSTVVVGRDSRQSGGQLAHAAMQALATQGYRVVDLGIVATPTVAVMIDHLHAAGGMVVTASHNPLPWNGLKVILHDAAAPPPELAAQIIANFQNSSGGAGVSPANESPAADAPATIFPITTDDTATAIHVQRIISRVDRQAIARRNFTVILDAVHGAGGRGAALLLEQLGVRLIPMHLEPTGQFPHPPEPTREHLTGLCQRLAHQRADLGFAQDPDADRLAVVDETGVYIGEEYTLALAVDHLLQTAGPRARGAVLAANLSTSRMIDDLAATHGARVLRTPVGEANVALAMRQSHALAGGEGNGGVIWPPIAMVRDSLGSMALILESLARHDGPLSSLVARIPRYAMVKDKLDLPRDRVPPLLKAMRKRWPQCRFDDRDGLRADWPDRWLHVRPSNTEPIIRLIAEAPDESAARQLIADAAALVKKK